MRRGWMCPQRTAGAFAAALLLLGCPILSCERSYAEQREALVKHALFARGISNVQVLTAMRKVPRHQFVPWYARAAAYDDRPLRIGHGQSISQPFIVATMTEAVSPKTTDRCLEVGTGSGYQAAVLAELCARVFSIEVLPEVAEFGAENLRAAGYGPDRVVLKVGDGYQGWPQHAPYQVIVVTAAPPHVPQPLLDQLDIGGRLIIPVGPDSESQYLERWVRRAKGTGSSALVHMRILAVRFVPFLGPGIEGGVADR